MHPAFVLHLCSWKSGHGPERFKSKFLSPSEI